MNETEKPPLIPPYQEAQIIKTKIKALRENTVWDSPSSVRVYVENLGKVLEMLLMQYHDDNAPPDIHEDVAIDMNDIHMNGLEARIWIGGKEYRAGNDLPAARQLLMRLRSTKVNIEEREDGLYVCHGNHERYEGCEYVKELEYASSPPAAEEQRPAFLRKIMD